MSNNPNETKAEIRKLLFEDGADHHDQWKEEELWVVNAIIMDLISWVLPAGRTAGWEPLHISLVLTTGCEVIITIPIYRWVKWGIERQIDVSKFYKREPEFNSHLPDFKADAFHYITIPFTVMFGESRNVSKTLVFTQTFLLWILLGCPACLLPSRIESVSLKTLAYVHLLWAQPPLANCFASWVFSDLCCVFHCDASDYDRTWGMCANAAGTRSVDSV